MCSAFAANRQQFAYVWIEAVVGSKQTNHNLTSALMKHTFKIAISGNHECTFDDSFLKSAGKPFIHVNEANNRSNFYA